MFSMDDFDSSEEVVDNPIEENIAPDEPTSEELAPIEESSVWKNHLRNLAVKQQ